MNLATKDIRHNLGRFALTTVGIGMLLMVVMGMGGIYRGVVEDATLLIDRVGADLWIVQRDTRGPFAELSRVPSEPGLSGGSRSGVQSSREFVYHTIQRQRDGKPLRIAVLGLSWPTDKGEWVPLTAGRPLGQSHYEMIADKTLGFAIGEQLKLGKETYTVVGTTSNMISSGGDGIAFFTVADAQAIQFDTPGEAVRLERAARESRGEDLRAGDSTTDDAGKRWKTNGTASRRRPTTNQRGDGHCFSREPTSNHVAEIISGWGDVSVFTADGQRELLLKGSVEKVRRQIGLFRVLLTVIAAIIMALILYTLDTR